MSSPNTIVLNSKLRFFGENSNSFTNEIPSVVNNATSLDIVLANFINFIYPFKSTNNTIKVDVTSGGSHTITIATDRYFNGGDTFATYLTSLFTADSSTITVTYDANSNRLSFAGGADGAFTIDESVTTALYKLGLGSNTDNGTSQLTHTGTANLNLLGTSAVYVGCSITNNTSVVASNGGATRFLNRDGGDKYNLIGVIPVNGDYGQVIPYQNSFNQIRLNPSSTEINNVRVQLFDDDFEFLNIDNDCNFMLLLHVNYSQGGL